MSLENPYSIDTDYSATSGDFAPTGGRVGVAPASNQAGKAALYKSPAGTFALGTVDASGNLNVSPQNPAGAAMQVYTGQPSPASSSQYGTLIMARMDTPSPSSYQAVTLDQVGALQVHPKSKATFNIIQAAVTCAANKSLFSLVNSGSTVLRVQRVWIYQPPQQSNGSLLGTASTPYYPLIAEMRRITGHTKGSSTASPSIATSDTADTFDSNVTCYSNATISGASPAPYHRQDILTTTNSGQAFWGRSDANAKVLVIRPGEGFSITCLSSGQIASNNGTTTASVDVEVQVTQASA